MDRDGVDVELEASFAMAGLGMEPMQLDPDVGAWRTEGAAKGVAMAGAATLRIGERSDRARAVRSRCAGLGAGAPWPDRWPNSTASSPWRGPTRRRTIPAPPASAALARSRALGWRAVLAAHEAAWDAHWAVSDIIIEGDDELQQALRFAVYHLTIAANPEDERVSIGARGLTGDAYLGHVFWDTEIYLLPFYTAVWPEAARALLMYRYHTLPGARAKAAHSGYKGALYAWESADTGEETTPERVVGPDGALSTFCAAGWSSTSAPISPTQCGSTGVQPAMTSSS